MIRYLGLDGGVSQSSRRTDGDFSPLESEDKLFFIGIHQCGGICCSFEGSALTVFVRSRRLRGIRSGGFQFPAGRDGRVGETHPEAKVNAGEVDREEGGNVVFPHCS